MKWHKIIIALPRPNESGEWTDSIDSLNNMAMQLKPNKCLSSLWYRVEPINGWNDKEGYKYELLVPSLTDRQILILRDLSYKIHTVGNMSKKTRRTLFQKVEK